MREMATTTADVTASVGNTGGVSWWADDKFGLLDRLLNHRREQGGTLGLSTGIQGSGKTTLNLGLARLYADAGEVVIWRGRDLDAWAGFPGDVVIWVEEGHDVGFWRIPHGSNTPEAWKLPVHRFADPADLVARAQPGVLNVVYARERDADGTPTRVWDAIVRALKDKVSAEWHALFVDEAHEVWWDRPEGDDDRAQRRVRDDLADFRKSFNSLFMSTHHADEIDYRILNKIQFQIYTRGSKPSRKSEVWPSACRQLQPGEAIIESLQFVKIRYPMIPKPSYQVIVREAPK